MKIGILTMQEVNNTGSFLQAYGLKSIIEGLGHEVGFINIVPGIQLASYKIGRFYKVKLMLKRMMVRHPLKQIRQTLLLHKRFNNEFKPELGVKPGRTKDHFDIVVIGSDEVFNIAQTTWFGFSQQLFGEGLNTDKVISYAGCFGATTLKKLDEIGLTNRVADLLKNFSAISIRDTNSFEVVSSLTGKNPILNVDPVIAYEFKNEIILPKREDAYLLIYTYPGRMNNPREVVAIKSYARKKGLRIVSVNNYFDWVDEVITPHPFEVLGYFKRSEAIVTDTFHGAVMSLKYNKHFAVIVRGMNNNKLTSLLSQFNLQDREVKNLEQLESVLTSEIDYNYVNKQIIKEQQNTVDYLLSNLR